MRFRDNAGNIVTVDSAMKITAQDGTVSYVDASVFQSQFSAAPIPDHSVNAVPATDNPNVPGKPDGLLAVTVNNTTCYIPFWKGTS